MKKIVVIGVIALFIGVGFQPAFAMDIPEKEEIEPKDYLFETIVAIANNPDVQDLLEENKHNINNLDFNNKYIFRQLFFKNQELLSSMVFTKPKMTTQYLDKIYNQGIELIDIFGEEKALEMLDSVEITNPKLLDDLKNIIMNYGELKNRILTLTEMNEELNPNEPFTDYQIICSIIIILEIMTFVKLWIYKTLVDILGDFPLLHDYFLTRLNLLFVRLLIVMLLIFRFDCFEY